MAAEGWLFKLWRPVSSTTYVLVISVAMLAVLDEVAAAESAAPRSILDAKAQEIAKAIEVLKSASTRLAGAKTMTFTATNTYEVLSPDGHPLYYTTINHVTFERPNKLRVITPGDGVPDEFYYDGKTMTAYVPSTDMKAIATAPATTDAMLDAAWEKGGIYFPFDDVIAADPYDALSTQMTSAFYVGQSHVIAGTVTDMVAVSNDHLEGELWIGAEDKLPRMVRVVYTDQPGQPHYETTFTDWTINGPVTPDTFVAIAASKAKVIPFAPPVAEAMPANPATLEHGQ